MRIRTVALWTVCGFAVLGAAQASAADVVPTDLTKPFEVDEHTIALYHLDDVSTGEVTDAVAGGKSGKVVGAAQAEGKFGKAMSGDGTKGWVDFADLPKTKPLTALTAECWVKFRDRASGDLVCRTGQFMIRVREHVQAYFWIDGAWRVVEGSKPVSVNRWTHMAVTWDQAAKMVRIYLDGQLDAAEEPEGVIDARLGEGNGSMRLGGHTWAQNAMALDGQLDEVRISSVARKYRAALAAAAKASPDGAPGGAPSIPGRGSPLRPWNTNTDPTDVAKSTVQEITEGSHEYTVVQGGTMDGRNCRTPMGCGMSREGAFYQTWESNRAVRMENVGETDVVNPWLSNGRNNFRNVAEIVAAAVTPDMTDAEKAFALWFQEIQYRHHSGGDNNELGDPVKVFNVYGYNTCGNDSICMGTLWHEAGLKVGPGPGPGTLHFPGILRQPLAFLRRRHALRLPLRDNETVAGEQDIVRDHDLVKRTHSQGNPLSGHLVGRAGNARACTSTRERSRADRSGKADTTMNMVLRPGEAIVWRWGQLDPVKYHGALMTMPTYVTYPSSSATASGNIARTSRKETWRKGATASRTSPPVRDGLAAGDGNNGHDRLDDAQPLCLRGRAARDGGRGADGSRSPTDGKTWQPVKDNLDRFFSDRRAGSLRVPAQVPVEGRRAAAELAIINDLQMAPLALPEMAVGENAFHLYRPVHRRRARCGSRTAGSSGRLPGRRRRRRRRLSARRRREPTAPTSFSGGHAAQDPRRRCRSATTSSSCPAAPTCRWPLSMCFYKLISRTADATKEKRQATAR